MGIEPRHTNSSSNPSLLLLKYSTVYFVNTIKLQHRTYLGKDRKTKYTQHRINIPDHIIKRIGWNDKNQVILNVNNKKKIIILEEFKTKNQR
jgi:hypothetical protein